ncbi:MAG TPA: hypothetical protein VF278_02160 [Pirellulales bacterium]
MAKFMRDAADVMCIELAQRARAAIVSARQLGRQQPSVELGVVVDPRCAAGRVPAANKRANLNGSVALPCQKQLKENDGLTVDVDALLRQGGFDFVSHLSAGVSSIGPHWLFAAHLKNTQRLGVVSIKLKGERPVALPLHAFTIEPPYFGQHTLQTITVIRFGLPIGRNEVDDTQDRMRLFRHGEAHRPDDLQRGCQSQAMKKFRHEGS